MNRSYDQYLKTYSGRDLMKKHNLGEVGTWQIKGEDPNCDFAGPHHQPDLGLFAGDLGSCIKYAVELSNFWAWGGGGSISKTKIVTDAEVVANFTKKGAALAKLTQEEIIILGLQDQV